MGRGRLGGYQVGNFPVLWSEWNGKYRDAIRRYWKGDDSLAGGDGLPAHGRVGPVRSCPAARPQASINFVTAHDGFTLHDLVTYNQKHNEANGEDNRDGANDNHVVELRRGGRDGRPRRSTRCASSRSATSSPRCSCRQGVPMLLAGDEMGRTQQGNNNAYCQDNELSWVDWNLDERSAGAAGVHRAA